MKIMQVMHNPGQGGAEQYSYLIAKYAKKDGHETVFVLGQEGPMVEKIKELGCSIRYLKMRFPFDPMAIKELAGIYKTEKPDIVQTHFLRENFLAISAAKISPVGAIFSTVHRIEPKTKVQGQLNQFFSKGLDKFIAVSDIVKEYLLQEGIKGSRIVIIPNGAEITRFDKEKIKRDIKIQDNRKIVSCIGRFSAEKNQSLLIDAFSKIENKNAVLVLVGQGEYKEKLEKKAVKRGLDKRVIFLGGRDKGYEIIGISDLYVQPSKIETFSITALEAMLQKVPIVASDIPAFKKLLGEGRGILFINNNSNDLAQCLGKALSNEKELKKMADAAYKYAKDRYTAEIMWSKTKKLYEHTLSIKAVREEK